MLSLRKNYAQFKPILRKRTDRRKDGPYFTGPFRLRPEVQKTKWPKTVGTKI